MPPRYLVRMQSKAAMSKQWHHDHHSGPPSCQPVHSISAKEDLPSYQQAQQSCSPPAYRERERNELAIDLLSFPRGSTILVIGAYTRHGMHIIDRLLEQDHQVRGVVSNPREAAHVSKHFEARFGRDLYHSCIVPNSTVEGALDHTTRTCSGVIFVTGQSGPIMDSNPEALAKVKNALGSAMEEVSMDRFVYCSAASTTSRPNPTSTGGTIDAAGDAIVHPPSEQPYSGNPRESLEEGTSVARAISTWIDLQQPAFAFDLVSIPRKFGTVIDGVIV